MNLRDLANEFTAFNGQMVIYYLPYQSLKSVGNINAVKRVQPEYKWVHEDGREVYTAPPDWTAEIQMAKSLERDPVTKWTHYRLWGMLHDVFAAVLPAIVHVEYHFNERTTAELRGLRMYFESQNGSPDKNWELYNELVGANVLEELQRGWHETRDQEFSAPTPESADPELEGGSVSS